MRIECIQYTISIAFVTTIHTESVGIASHEMKDLLASGVIRAAPASVLMRENNFIQGGQGEQL